MTQAVTQSNAFFQKAESMRATGRPFAVATVISVRGSASAKPGSKAIIDEQGKNVWGWVGGGCAESFVARNAVEAMTEGRTRIVQADLDDEIFGLGMPCGGVMDVYIEPQRAPEPILLREGGELEPFLSHLARDMGFAPEFESGRAGIEAPELERGLFALATAIAVSRGTRMIPLRQLRGVFADGGERTPWTPSEPELLVLGSSRITEEMAQFGAIAKWKVRVYGWNLDPASYPSRAVLEEAAPDFGNLVVNAGSAVVVASHHKGDHEFIRRSLEAGANYVGLVASEKRSKLVFAHLAELGSSEARLRRIHAPSGLDLGCRTPQEIALSCFAEILSEKAAGKAGVS